MTKSQILGVFLQMLTFRTILFRWTNPFLYSGVAGGEDRRGLDGVDQGARARGAVPRSACIAVPRRARIAVPRSARIQGSKTCVSLNFRLEIKKEMCTGDNQVVKTEEDSIVSTRSA